MSKADLMTDDWVKTPEGNYRVIGVLGDVVYTDLRDDERDGTAFSDYDVEPIPITSEILEKNGFTCDNNVAKLTIRDDSKSEFFECKYVFLTNSIQIHDKIEEQKLRVKCYSVHELQHIFRLLEIENEIII